MEQEIILEARNITKVYPGGVVANHNVNLQIKKGEIHALVGENGAGKSTLMKMLFGMLAPTEGQIFVDGKEVHFSSSSDAIAAGLGMVHQHFMQVPSMTVAENLILGAEPGTALKVDRKEAVRITTELSDKYNLKGSVQSGAAETRHLRRMPSRPLRSSSWSIACLQGSGATNAPRRMPFGCSWFR